MWQPVRGEPQSVLVSGLQMDGDRVVNQRPNLAFLEEGPEGVPRGRSDDVLVVNVKCASLLTRKLEMRSAESIVVLAGDGVPLVVFVSKMSEFRAQNS
jgi:hypothetical protein